jgi:hypothetical protein
MSVISITVKETLQLKIETPKRKPRVSIFPQKSYTSNYKPNKQRISFIHVQNRLFSSKKIHGLFDITIKEVKIHAIKIKETVELKKNLEDKRKLTSNTKVPEISDFSLNNLLISENYRVFHFVFVLVSLMIF